MGKPASSCFKIMGCGVGDAVGNDDLAPVEVNVSSDKWRWSFRKRSFKQRVLTTVILEPISVCSSKESQEVPTANLHSPKYSPERAQVHEKQIETSPLSSDINTEVSHFLHDRSTTPDNPSFNESDAVVVQAAIRGNLTKDDTHKLESIIKLQAAVRGNLVRRQAVGTLRCILAIIRMQALLRSRYHHRLMSLEDKKFQEDRDSLMESNGSSIDKLLSNGFAHKLLETTPRRKSMHIKCDISKHDSAWKWLEMWMAATSTGVAHQLHERNLNHSESLLQGKANLADRESKNETPHTVSLLLSDPLLAPTELVTAQKGEYSSIEKNKNSESLASVFAPNNSFNYLLESDVGKSESEKEILGAKIQGYTDTKVVNDESLNCISDNKESKIETDPTELESMEDRTNYCIERTSFEIVENEGKKSFINSRKLCNPAFVAAQTKFEEQTSRSTVGRSFSSFQSAVLKSKSANLNFPASSMTDENEAISVENSIPYSRVEIASSECGTEISISSTLDSPDRSDMEGGEIVLEIGALENKNYGISGAENAFDANLFDGDRIHDQGDHSTAISSGQPAEVTTSDAFVHLEGTHELATKLPEGPPRTCLAVPDPHGTPSSEASTEAKKNKDDNAPTHRQRLKLVGKRITSNPNTDSGGRGSTENLMKDSKMPKRRNSFGIAKTEHFDQEPRLSSSNSLPSYMQATASARAKAHPSASQKSSPDLHDNQPKKRHSLPIENGKQSSSPRMQRSSSQAQQNAKDNGAQSPRASADKRWQR